MTTEDIYKSALEEIANYAMTAERDLIYTLCKSALLKGAERKRFIKPSVDVIGEYCRERKNTVDPLRFFDHYESNGWRVGRNPMKDWRAAVRTWEKQSFGYGEKSSEQPANRLIMRNSLVLPEPESEASVNAAAEQAKKMFKSIVTKSKMEAV